MRAARLHGVGDVRLTELPTPQAGPGEELVRVTAVGICGSDLHWYAEAGIGDARLREPLTLGHEFAGVVEGGPRHGLRVAVDPARPCEECETCRTGHRNLCPTVGFAGHRSTDGGLQDYVAWPSALLEPLPDSLSDADGAMLEPLGVAVHAADLAHLRVASRVAVIGCGPLGLLLLQVARAAGATTVVASDPLPHRRDAAKRLGADAVLDSGDSADDAAWRDLTEGGADVAFEVAGTDEAVDTATVAARPGARVVLVGIPSGDRTSFNASLARRKGLTLVMSRRMGDVYPRATALATRGLVDVRSVVSKSYPLAEVQEAFASAVTRTGLKVVVEPDGRASEPQG
ncbi:MAG: zinc-dependent alcohol dehydrogenase [Actinomycetes bacterium]